MVYLGIDIAKAKVDASLLKGDRYKHSGFENTLKGFQKLLSWLAPVSDGHGCLEATGRDGFALASYVKEQGCKVRVVKPARIKGLANSELSRNKTDKLAAALMARFCENSPRLWQAPREEENFQAL